MGFSFIKLFEIKDDADMAELMVQFSKENIFAQAGQSMLAQANTKASIEERRMFCIKYVLMCIISVNYMHMIEYFSIFILAYNQEKDYKVRIIIG